MPIPQIKKSSSFQTRRFDREHRPHHQQALPPHRKQKARASWKKRALFLALWGSLLTVFLFVVAFFWYSRDLPDPNKLIDRDVAQSTKIYDRTGEHLLYEIHGTQRRTLIELSSIPDLAIKATIAVEDKNFYKHSGVSIWGILRGQIMPRLQGRRAQGGSTLTQQFVKNAILTNERTLGRKIKEWVLSYQIEKKFTKEEILKLYFNEIPYGSTAYGIESASGIYFGKLAKDLTLAESAILAALPQAPSYFSPYGPNKELLIQRQHLILNLMTEQEYITSDQAEAAKKEVIAFKTKREDITAPHFVFMVKAELADEFGERLVEQGGLKIITTIDWEKQQLAEKTMEELGPGLQEKYDASNAALVTIDVESGDVLALVGSKDYFDDSIDGQFNVATALRQPGSSLKPFVYAQAFARGFRPDTVLVDSFTNFSAVGTPYQPRNYDDKEHGPVTIRQALAGSLNIPAVKALYLAGPKEVIRTLQNLGYTTLNDPDRYGLSLVLGGGEVKLLEHTNGYAALAREGVYQPYSTILKVEDNKGSVMREKKEVDQKRVIEKNIVRQITNILSDNEARAYIFGANNYLTLSERPVAAKTGTTNDYLDSWLIGYTPQIVTGVWVGNNDNISMNRGTGATAAGPIWQSYMRAIMAGYPVVGFGVPTLEPCTKMMVCGQAVREADVPVDTRTNKPADSSTPPEFVATKHLKELRSILHYVDKENPLGPIPNKPENDPQYSLWQRGVEEWIKTHTEEGYIDVLPDGYVDSGNPEDRPTVQWQEPTNDQVIINPEQKLLVSVQSKYKISRVDFYLNNQLIGSSSQSPYTLPLSIPAGLKNGTYSLKAVATDEYGNSQSNSLTITLNLPIQQLSFNPIWVTPVVSEQYTIKSLPSKLLVTMNNFKNARKVDFYYSHDNQSKWLGVIESPTESVLSLDWTKPEASGQYKLYLVITDIYGFVQTSPEILINIK